MGTGKTKTDNSHKNGGRQESSSRPVSDSSSAPVQTSAPQPSPLRLSPIDPSRAHAPNRRLPPLFPRPGPMTQPQNPAQPPPNGNNAYPSKIFPATVQPAASLTHSLQSIYLREIEFHCICAARRFWEDHRPKPMLSLAVPNAARPSRPPSFDAPWRTINLLTHPAFQGLQQPIAKIFRAADQATGNDDGLGLREYLSLIADLDWDRVRRQQRQQHMVQQDQQRLQQHPQQQHQHQQEAHLHQGQQQLPPSGHPKNPALITIPPPTFPPPNTNVAHTARQEYSPRFTTAHLLDDLHTWCEAVMGAIQKVNVGDGDEGPVKLSLAELEGVVSSAKGLALSLNGTMEHHAIEGVWAKCLQSSHP
ncbi:hypothetical protein GX51_01630 [Blastomyces parvus]|uniref:Uncharacterized protein n=1 Tax=Blastomyces parvus TaxID=2060905 RepID=A0A2B7XFY3_9EURO|nr:hypothetical protein GX51_01630 [Blastomyces parvus]